MSELEMDPIETLRSTIPDFARDLSLNLQTTLSGGSLSTRQRWGVALATAITAGSPALRQAVEAAATAGSDPETLDDARAGASLMAMNNVYYRFRHIVGKEAYSQMPARLRMQRIAKPATDKATFELICLAVSAINGCEACVRSHEAAVLHAGLTEENVHDAIRIAATMRGVAVALGAT